MAVWGLSIGALLFACLAMPAPASGPGPVETWAVDRDGGRLVGLDGDLFMTESWPMRKPVLCAVGGQGLWIVEARGGSAIGDHALLLKIDGERPLVVPGGTQLGPIIDLETADGGAALMVEFGLVGKPTRILRGQKAGVAAIAKHPGALSVVGSAKGFWVGDETGWLTRYAEDGTKVARVEIGGQLGDLALLSDGGMFVLDVASPGRLIRLDPNLAVTWAVSSGLETAQLGIVPASEQVWLADSTEPLARRFGLAGKLELQVSLLASDATSVLAQKGGGVLIGTPGAILRIGEQGAALPGQGGFGYLTGLAGE